VVIYGTNNIKKVNLTDFSTIDTLGIGQPSYALVVHDGYLYCGNYTGTNNIKKVNLTDFSTIDTLDIGQPSRALVVHDGYLYCGGIY
jgi:hypothetical protein